MWWSRNSSSNVKLGASYSWPDHPRPYPTCPKPNQRVCCNPETSTVILIDGVPTFERPNSWPPLGLDKVPNEIGSKGGVKKYLELELARADATNDDDRWYWANHMLNTMRDDCWKFYSQHKQWNKDGVFVVGRTTAIYNEAERDPVAMREKFEDDLRRGVFKIGEIYPEFATAQPMSS